MTEQDKKNLPILCFENQPDWEGWLDQHNTQKDGIWLKFSKKGSGIASVDYLDAVETALCYGWIDSRIAAFDSHYYLQKFSPRRAKSKWSKTNCEKAEALIAAGRMKPAGLIQINLAKADGRWAAAYDPQSQITIPEDLKRELDQNPTAKQFFATLNSHNRFAILHRIQAAKKPETRLRRIKKFVGMLANRQKIYP